MTDEKLESRKNAILQKEYWTTDEAEFYLIYIKGIHRTSASLRTYITRGGGPAHFKWSRSVRYNKALIDEWIQKKLSPAKTHSLDKGVEA